MTGMTHDETEEKKSLNFVEEIVVNDLKAGKNDGRLQTRFPPEPNGYLHIGHAKAICMDFGIAEKYNGVCNLRLDDTNPIKEDTEYVEAIKKDIQWLGFKWENIYHASDYFQQLWDFAVRLIKEGKAYVDEQSSEQIALQKGTPTQPGTPSPFRDRPIEENLELFNKMNSGEAEEGSMVLRAKLDMGSPNMHFRDPIIYRIINKEHHRTGNKWKAYPMYDFAHGQSDYFEGVTHSICTLEFVPHRPLYDHFIDELKEGKDLNNHRPRQIEFNRLNLTYTVMSKRKLLALVKEGLVNGWDDPRMPTLCGLRRRGYSPESIRKFIDMIGYTKFDALNDVAMLEAYVLQSLIDGADDGGAGVVGIEDGAPGRVVLLRRQGLLQLRVFFGPVLLVRVKGIRQSAPAHIAGQDLLFLRCGPAPFCLDSLQGTDGVQVAAKLLLGSALAQVVIRDAEIFAPGLCLLGGAHGRELGRSFRQGRGGRRGLFCFGRWAHVQRGEGGRLRFFLRRDGGEGRCGVHGGRGFLLLAPALDGPLDLPQDQLRAVVDRTAQHGGGQSGVKLPDRREVVLRKASLGRQAAADHE